MNSVLKSSTPETFPQNDNNISEHIARLETELLALRQKAEYWEAMAMTDDLTGLHNRRLLGDIGSGFLEQRQTGREDNTTLLFIDLDDFGKLNKRYGDDVGDQALRVLADAVRKNIRKDDIAIRKGGDEFVIILVEASLQTTNDHVLCRIQKLLNGDLTLDVDGEKIAIKGSVGAFPYDRQETPFNNIKRADALMREEKQMRKALS